MTLVNSETGEVVADLTPDEARDLTDRIKATAEALWSLLAEAHDRQAWKALGYSSFSAYVEAEFDMSRRHAYRLLDQALVIRELEHAAGVTHGSQISEREARDIKPNLDVVQQEIRDRIDSGEEPVTAIRSTVGNRSAPRPKSHLSEVTDAPPSDPTVAEVVTVIPWSFKKEVTEHEPRAAREAGSFFDTKAIRAHDVWVKHLDAFPARLRPAAAVVARQQVQFWQEAADRLTRSTGPRSA